MATAEFIPKTNTIYGCVPKKFQDEQRERFLLLRSARAGDPRAIAVLWERYHLRVIPVPPPGADPTEVNMKKEKVACKHCGKMVSVGGRWKHEHRTCPQRPGAGAAPDPAQATAIARRPARRTAETPARIPDAPVGMTLDQVRASLEQFRDEITTTLRVLDRVEHTFRQQSAA
jgi:hypothetical protein